MYDCRHMISGKKFGRSIGGLFLSILLLLSAGCASMSGNEGTAPKMDGSQKTITGISTAASADSESVMIKANRQLNYTSVKQHDPLGVILLFPETVFGDISSEPATENEVIKSITPTLSSDQKNTRLEIDLKEDLPYEVKKNSSGLEIIFSRPEMASQDEPPEGGEVSPGVEEANSAMTAPAEMGSQEMAEETIGENSPVIELTASQELNSETAVINKIDFSSQESGKSMIIIGTDIPVKYDIRKVADKTLKIRIYNSRLPQYRRHRPLITTRFESAVDRISPVQAAGVENTTDLIVELRQWVPYRPVSEDNLITITFDASSIGPRPFESANLPPWQQVLEVAEYSVQSQETGSEMPQADEFDEEKAAMEELLGQKKVYTGQKIALDFYKTDIKNVFRILQQVSGKNYAVDKNVTGEVTISLEKPVPWDQVLDLILKMNQLGKVEQGDIIRIATTATLSAEEVAQQKKMEAIRARQEQQKTLEPLVTEYVPINYADATSEILPHIQNVLTEDRGTMTVDSRNNQIIITDTRATLSKAKEIIAQIDKVTPQVLIEARIVEVNDDFSREVGMSWGASGDEIYKDNLDGQYSYNIAMNTPFTADPETSGAIDFNFTRLDAWGTPFVLDAALKAMEQSGNGKIISSPKILTLDNQKAMIRQGQRVPYQTVEDGEVNVEFEDVDLLLEVTPHVTPDRRISMQIFTTKNEIVGFTESGDPITSTNEAETRLLVDDGETIVIGGVVKNDIKYSESGFPILKEIPMIGWLFKSKSETSTKQELLIFMTPRIVQLEQRNMVQAEN